MAPVLTTQEYMDVPQVHHNGLVVDVNDPVLGDMKQVGHPIIFSETPGKVRGPAPVDGVEMPSSSLPEELFPKREDDEEALDPSPRTRAPRRTPSDAVAGAKGAGFLGVHCGAAGANGFVRPGGGRGERWSRFMGRGRTVFPCSFSGQIGGRGTWHLT